MSSPSADEEAVVRLNDDDETQQLSSIITPSQHLRSTLALCLCTLTHAYLLISVFPYAGFMAMDLIDGVNEENAGMYAGLIGASFMAGRALTSYQWGKWADTYGRTTILHLSLGFSCLFTLLFGLSSSFAWAITVRFMLGFGNGLLGTVKTSVSELASGSEKLEARGMGLVMGMWGWGFLFAPALGGALAEPLRQYPGSELLQPFEGILSRFPFLLPNLLAAFFCITAMLGVYIFVEETLPKDKRRSPANIPVDIMLWWKEAVLTKVMCRKRNAGEVQPLATTQSVTYNSTEEAHETTGDDDMHEAAMKHSESCSFLSTAANRVADSRKQPRRESKSDATEATISSLWKKYDTRVNLLIYWAYSFVSISLDEAFPLYCMSKTAGLSLSEKSIGSILSLSGLIFAVCQYFVFATVVNLFGVYRAIQVASLAVVPLVLLFPVAILLNQGVADGELSWNVMVFLGTLQAAYRVGASIVFSSISISINRSVATHHRGAINGLAVLGGSFVKALGPAFSGALVAFCVASGVFAPHVGIVVAYAIFGSLSATVAYACNYWLPKPSEAP